MQNSCGLVIGESKQIEPGNLDIIEMHERNIAHIHSCLLLTRKGVQSRTAEVLLQQRGFDKAQYPGHWCFSAAGHCNENDFIRALELGGEADLEGLVRETQEELGIELDLSGGAEVLPHINDAIGVDRRTTEGRLYRLIDGPFTSQKNGIQPYNEHPILTVGWFHLVKGVTVQLGSSEVESMSWVPIDQLREMKLTPWLEYFLRFAPDATSHKTGRQYNYGQSERHPQVARSTVSAVF